MCCSHCFLAHHWIVLFTRINVLKLLLQQNTYFITKNERACLINPRFVAKSRVLSLNLTLFVLKTKCMCCSHFFTCSLKQLQVFFITWLNKQVFQRKQHYLCWVRWNERVGLSLKAKGLWSLSSLLLVGCYSGRYYGHDSYLSTTFILFLFLSFYSYVVTFAASTRTIKARLYQIIKEVLHGKRMSYSPVE